MASGLKLKMVCFQGSRLSRPISLSSQAEASGHTDEQDSAADLGCQQLAEMLFIHKKQQANGSSEHKT